MLSGCNQEKVGPGEVRGGRADRALGEAVTGGHHQAGEGGVGSQPLGRVREVL